MNNFHYNLFVNTYHVNIVGDKCFYETSRSILKYIKKTKYFRLSKKLVLRFMEIVKPY